MGKKVATVAAVALAAWISGVLAPSDARVQAEHGQGAAMFISPPSNEEQKSDSGTKPIPEPLRNLLATSAARAAGAEPSFCAWLRDFVRRHGRERTIEIARLRYTDAAIAAARRECFPRAKSNGR